MKQGYVNAKEACEYLGMPMATLYGLTHRRQIPHIKRGRILMFKKDDIDQWMEQQRVPIAAGIEPLAGA